ncbi:hypothetical protein G1C96_0295 [Bifidobacterium sp. DSM 109958]|uniref:Uncharacterized protein n=1 Tax=Bifidobacterium moraviense TaxID=2675323 RepID=A0A7Y0F0E2_9BIFI|nr:hypothetical protein [Bifidobacterium sp. DSM 109958]NMM99717.1 hypothetical protein [Bifidobacterium sp. DSM 109958]
MTANGNRSSSRFRWLGILWIILALGAFGMMGVNGLAMHTPSLQAPAAALRLYWVTIGLGVILLVGVPVQKLRASDKATRNIGMILCAVGGLALIIYGAQCVGRWDADRREGPQDATATVLDVREKEYRDDDTNHVTDVDWILTIRLPDGDTREWTLADEPDPPISAGDTVDVTYWRRTNILTSISLTR